MSTALDRSRGLISWRIAVCFACVAVAMTAPSAHAQGSPEQAVTDLNRDAMEAYNALDINKAGGLLEQALRIVSGGGVSPQLAARTHQNLGIVYIGGLNDQNNGFNSFLQAICSDPNSQLDPLTSTPDIQNVWNAAMQRARAGGCPTGAPAAPMPGPMPMGPQPMPVGPIMGPQPMPMAPPQPMPPPPDQAIAHRSPPEQLSQTPLPLYAEIHPLAKARKAFVYYKGQGMKQYKRVPMYQYQSGVAYQVSCTDMWEPKLSYYIEAQDDNGSIVGTAGTATQPIEVPVVTTRTQQGEPSLPGAQPPTSCAARECPPGVQGCAQPGKAAIGDKCSGNNECQAGLECRDDECGLIGGGGTDIPEAGMGPEGFTPGKPAEFKPTFVQLGFGVGLAYVQAGMAADRSPPRNRVFLDQSTLQFVDDPQAALSNGQMIEFPEPGGPSAAQLNAWVPDADSEDSKGPLKGNCAADGKKSGPNMPQLFPTKYCVRVKQPGFVPNPMLRLAVGHFILPRFALVGLMRFQFSHGNGGFSGILLGARGEYLFTKPTPMGLMVSGFGGLTFGQIQARPPATGTTQGAPFVKSGPAGVHVGATVRYRFTEHVGLFAAPEVDVQLPMLLMNVDFTLAGVEAAF
ncbi:MAG: hypothetical protein ACHQ53_09655 [Polyangiales bacterium]